MKRSGISRSAWLQLGFGAQLCCAVLGALLVARPLWHIGQRELLRHRAAGRWSRTLAAPEQPLRSGLPVAWLSAPTAGIEELLVFGDDPEDLHQHPSWSARGAWPGETGLRVIQGHRDTHFRELGNLAIGDAISLETRAGQYSYRIVDTEVLSPEGLERRIQSPRDGQWLMLVTCYPFRYIGPAPKRYVVWARAARPG